MWGIIWPLLIKTKSAVGKTPFSSYPEIQSYTYLGSLDNFDNILERYWDLLFGLIIMLCSSFVEMILYFLCIFLKLKTIFIVNFSKIHFFRTFFNLGGSIHAGESIEDPIPKNEQVPTWLWLLGLSVSSMYYSFL